MWASISFCAKLSNFYEIKIRTIEGQKKNSKKKFFIGIGFEERIGRGNRKLLLQKLHRRL